MKTGKPTRLGGETLPFAAGCLNSHTADFPAFRRICSKGQFIP